MPPTNDARAVVFAGSEFPLEMRTFPLPQLAAGELLVRITCSTVCGSDLHTFGGRRSTPVPTVLGHEIIGVIEAFGPGGPIEDLDGVPLRIGDRVTWSIAASCGACFFCKRRLPQKCAHLFKYGHERITERHPLSGGLADYCHLAPGTAVVRLPENLPDAVACPANCATATVAAAFRTANLDPLDLENGAVLIQGAGMLGLTACAMAEAMGWRQIFVADVAEERLSLARQFGATHCIALSGDAAGLPGIVVDATGGKGVDLAIEVSGAHAAMANGLDTLRIGGHYVLVGAAFPSPPISVDPEKVIRRLLTLQGIHNYIPADLKYAVDFLKNHYRQFSFDTLVARKFALADAQAAFEYASEHRPLRIAVVP